MLLKEQPPGEGGRCTEKVQIPNTLEFSILSPSTMDNSLLFSSKV